MKGSMASSQPSPTFDSTSDLSRLSPDMIGRLPADSEIWASLKQAISASSGFQRWQLERGDDSEINQLNLDQVVRYYLRETLATLAY